MMAVDESLITRCAGKDASVYRKIKIRDMRTEVCGAVHTSCSGAPFGAAFSIIRHASIPNHSCHALSAKLFFGLG